MPNIAKADTCTEFFTLLHTEKQPLFSLKAQIVRSITPEIVIRKKVSSIGFS